MPEYLSPGVYIEETEGGPRPIEGVSTSTAGFLGRTERGPTDPRLVTSFADFERLFGGFELTKQGERLEETFTAFGVDGFFRNGGTRCYVGRIAAESATVGEASLGATEAPLAVDPKTLDFGDVIESHRTTATVTLTHVGESDDPAVTIESADDVTMTVSSGGASEFGVDAPAADAYPITLEPGDSQAVTVAFSPADTDDKAATLAVDHDGTNAPAEVAITGSGTAPTPNTLGPAPDSIDFGTLVENHTASRTVTYTNLGPQGGPSISVQGDEVEIVDTGAGAVPGDAEHFSAAFVEGAGSVTVGSADSFEVDPGESFTVEVTFEPTGTGTMTDVELQVADASTSVTLDGEGTSPTAGELGVPGGSSGVDFGDAVTGQQRRATVRLTNLGDPTAGDPDVDVDAPGARIVAAPGGDPGQADDYDVDGPDEVRTLAPGGSIEFDVRFVPGAAEPRDASLSVPYTASGSDKTAKVALSGTGAEPAPLGLSRDRVDFGTVDPAGDPDTESVTLENVAEAGGPDVEIGDAGDVWIDAPSGDDDLFGVAVKASDGSDASFPVTLGPGDTVTVEMTFDPNDADPRSADLVVEYNRNDGSPGPTETVRVPLVANRDVLDAEAIGPGAWGGNVALVVKDGSLYKEGQNQLFKLTVRYWTHDRDARTARKYGGDPTEDERVPEPDVEEVYDNLSPDVTSSDYYESRLNGTSNLVELTRVAEGRPEPTETAVWLSGASEGDELSVSDYTGQADPSWRDEDEKTGLRAFEAVDNISIVCVPDEGSILDGQGNSALTGPIRDHCENMADRFAVLQSKRRAGKISDIEPPVVSDYAAFYYPWIRVRNPETGLSELVPPGGYVAGIYARSDNEKGVHKAPANEIVNGAQGLQRDITKGEQDVLNPKGVNCIRSFPGRGIRVWGARTASSDPLWKYVNVRRLFLFLEESIEESTQWAVFEPNDESLWAQIRQTVRNFLMTVWRDGALMGSTPEEAFYVKCDRTTMTQADIDNGRLIVEIGVAPVKPAEFVVFRITQWTEGVEEG